MSDRHDPALDRLIAESAAQLALEIEAEAPALCPDFAAVLEEAAARGLIHPPHDLRLAAPNDPHALPRGRESSQLAPPLAPGDPLAALLHDAQRAANADTAARALLALPPAPRPRARPPAWLGALLALAAVCLLVIGLRPLLAQPTLQSSAPNQAEWRDLERRAASPIPNIEPALAQPARRAEPTERPLSGAELDPLPPEDRAALAQPELAPPELAPPELTQPELTQPSPPRPELTDDDPIAALERAAEARWSAGDLQGAEHHLREIIRRTRSARQRDLAYGDLFTITRQLRGRDAEAALWSEYLARVPRGRYADDARAGLCRRDDDPPSCWREYLKQHPHGAHRGEAERAAALPSP